MNGPIIDMTPEGGFPPRTERSLATQILRAGIIVAVLAGTLAVAAIALWVALLLIPIALGAAVVAWLAWRWRVWQGRGYSAATAKDVRSRAASASNL